MRQLIAGNWKMNGTRASAAALLERLRAAAPDLGCDLLVCPPATLIGTAAAILGGSAVHLGGQDCHTEALGAHTGDLSAPMLADAGARWVILGHSERRADYGETDALVRRKAGAAVAAGLRPVVCVGETEADRLAGHAEDVVRRQLTGSLPDDFAGVVAYEPVWAIGTGRVAAPEDVAAMHACIRAALRARFGIPGGDILILYGGSVKPGNAAGLLGLPEVGGALVGGASLNAEDFLAIASAAPALSIADAGG